MRKKIGRPKGSVEREREHLYLLKTNTLRLSRFNHKSAIVDAALNEFFEKYGENLFDLFPHKK